MDEEVASESEAAEEEPGEEAWRADVEQELQAPARQVEESVQFFARFCLDRRPVRSFTRNDVPFFTHWATPNSWVRELAESGSHPAPSIRPRAHTAPQHVHRLLSDTPTRVRSYPLSSLPICALITAYQSFISNVRHRDWRICCGARVYAVHPKFLERTGGD